MIRVPTLKGLLSLVACSVIVAGSLHAQIRVDSVRGVVGKEVSLTFLYERNTSIDPGTTLTIAADMKLSNPTVFFPQVFRPGSTLDVINSSLSSSTDSTYSFSVLLQVRGVALEKGDTLFTLAGETLAGSDSVTDLIFTNVKLDEQSLPNMVGRILSESIGPRLPYVRPATLDPGRPNPTTTGQTVTWGFRIDKRSEVFIKIYDVVGREVNVHDFGVLDQGVYLYTFTPDVTVPSSLYIVRLISNSGEATQAMHVVR